MAEAYLGVKGVSPLPRVEFNAPPAETRTPRKRTAVWSASLLKMKASGLSVIPQGILCYLKSLRLLIQFNYGFEDVYKLFNEPKNRYKVA